MLEVKIGLFFAVTWRAPVLVPVVAERDRVGLEPLALLSDALGGRGGGTNGLLSESHGKSFPPRFSLLLILTLELCCFSIFASSARAWHSSSASCMYCNLIDS